jgi:hypothetical protein
MSAELEALPSSVPRLPARSSWRKGSPAPSRRRKTSRPVAAGQMKPGGSSERGKGGSPEAGGGSVEGAPGGGASMDDGSPAGAGIVIETAAGGATAAGSVGVTEGTTSEA